MALVQLELYGSVAEDLTKVWRILETEMASDEPSVVRLLDTLTYKRGKMLRPALVLLGGKAFDRVTETHYSLAAVVEMVHLASLIHDDVIDEADSRRNRPSVNQTLGNEGAVLLGDFVMAAAFETCSGLRSHEANRILSATCRTICVGELMQVAQRRNLELGEAAYLDIISKKTASLLRTCGQFGAVFGEADASAVMSLSRYGHDLGMAFQIADDVLDFVGSEEEMGKTLGRDLDKGELTLPLIRFLETRNGSARAALEGAIEDPRPERLGRIRELIHESDSLEYCRRLASRYAHQAVDHLADLPDSEARNSLIAVADFVLSRRH